MLPAAPKRLQTEPGVLRLSWIRLDSGVTILGQFEDETFSVSWPENRRSVPAVVGAWLKRADRILLHPYGDLRGRDLHMLTWKGRPLAEQIAVAYALDLATVPADNAAHAALVVVDPSGELEHGPEEEDVVSDALRRSGAEVASIRGDVAELRALLRNVDWFHFGGHGSWSPDDPMAGGLALADGNRLGLGDILAAPRVPHTVVLTSCEAGRGAGRGGEAFGIAHAFLVAGSRIVIAPNRKVTDEEAARFAMAFYRAEGTALDRYRAAIAALGQSGSAFRAFVP